MNIAVTAPKRFAHQDLVCVDLALRWRDAPALQLWSEPTGGEDARLSWHAGSSPTTLEVQIKDEVGAADLDRLVDILTHFPARLARHTLLERLVADPNSAVLVVVSARCRDDVANLIAPPGWDGSRRASPVADDLLAGNLLTAIASRAAAGKSQTALEAARTSHLSKVAMSSHADVKSALNRVFIAERERPADVFVRVQHTLSTDLGVPTDRLADGSRRLAAIIDAYKGTDRDAMPALSAAAAGLAPTSLAPSGYVERGTEDDLAASLAGRSVLLLSGGPRTGKTWTSRAIAGRLQRQGYAVRVGSEVEEAERYLLDPDGAERCFLLDDPFGAQLAIATAATDAGTLRRLIGKLPPNRRLVVAQRREPLLEAWRQRSLEACAIDGVHWRDLGEIDVAVCIAIWHAAASDAALDDGFVQRVETLIRRDDLREPGALTFLAWNARDLPEGADTAQIVAVARRDAAGVAAEIVERIPGATNVLVALAVSTVPTIAVADMELAVALRADGTRPSESRSVGRTITIGGPERVPEPLPSYGEIPTLKVEDKASLEGLIRRRLAVAESPTESNFAHPFYRAAGQILSVPDIQRGDVPALRSLDAALFSLSPHTSRSAARNIPWLLASLVGRPDAVRALFELAEDGLASLFPATRDLCFAFLIDNLERLPADFRVDLQSWVGCVIVRFEDVSDHDGNAWIEGDMDGGEMYRRYYDRPAFETVEPLVIAMESGAPLDLDFAMARQLLQALARDPGRLTEIVARRLLAFDEAMVRAEVAKLWLSVPRQEDADLLRRVGGERHPSIAVAALQGAVQAWPSVDEGRRAQLTHLIEGFAASPGSAIALFLQLIVFDREEHYGAEPPWELCCRAIAVALPRLPLRLVFTDSRLPNVLDKAIEHLDAATIAPAWSAWVARIVAQVVEHLPSEFELAAVPIILRGTKGAPHCRAGLIHALLDVPSTAARIVFVADLVDCWDDLEDVERRDLIALLCRDAADRKWMQAAALTRVVLPPPVQQAVLGAPDAMSRAPSDLEAMLDPELLAAGLRIHAGEPQPLWWLGTHHRPSVFWKAYALDVAHRPRHIDFEIAFDCALLQAEDGTLLEAMIAQADDADLDTIFANMLARAKGAISWHTTSWVSLLERGERCGLLDTWLDRMKAVAPQLLDRPSDIRAWLGDGLIATRFASSFAADLAALAVARVLTEMHDVEERLASYRDDEDSDEEDAVETVDKEAMVRLLLDRQPPVFEWSLTALKSALVRAGSTDKQLIERLQDARMAAIDTKHPALPEVSADFTAWQGPK